MSPDFDAVLVCLQCISNFELPCNGQRQCRALTEPVLLCLHLDRQTSPAEACAVAACVVTSYPGHQDYALIQAHK